MFSVGQKAKQNNKQSKGTHGAKLQAHNPGVLVEAPPFLIPPITLKMAWSPLLQNNPAQQWIRRLIVEVRIARPLFQYRSATFHPRIAYVYQQNR